MYSPRGQFEDDAGKIRGTSTETQSQASTQATISTMFGTLQRDPKSDDVVFVTHDSASFIAKMHGSKFSQHVACNKCRSEKVRGRIGMFGRGSLLMHLVTAAMFRGERRMQSLQEQQSHMHIFQTWPGRASQTPKTTLS